METLDCRKELVAHFRAFLKKSGIAARCAAQLSSKDAVQISVPAYEAKFTAEEQRDIQAFAIAQGLTLVRGLPIRADDVRDVLGQQFCFYLTEEGKSAWRELALRMPNIYRRRNSQPATA